VLIIEKARGEGLAAKEARAGSEKKTEKSGGPVNFRYGGLIFY
jgi:hypothetical protein